MRINVISSNLNKKKVNNSNFIETVLNEIFLISENDPNFKKDNEVKKNEIKLNKIKDKLKKQNIILDKSKKFEKEIIEKIELLDNEIIKEKSELLYKLGSEL